MIKIGNLKSSPFVKNTLLLTSGTALSQLILFVSTIALARLYSKNDYGDLSNYMAIIGIIGGIAAFRYELTIILPQKRDDSKNLLVFCIISSFFIAVVSLILLLFFGNILFNYLNIQHHVSYSIAISLGIFFLGVNNAFENWFNRESEYKKIMSAKIIYSLSSTILKVILGVISISLGLIYGTVLGFFITILVFVAFFIQSEHPGSLFGISIKNIKSQLIEYKDFFKYSTLGSTLNTISNVGLLLLISYFYSIELAGIYFFANNVIRQPLGFISTSFYVDINIKKM